MVGKSCWLNLRGANGNGRESKTSLDLKWTTWTKTWEPLDVEHLNKISTKEIYKDFTSTFPPPKVIFKYENMPWDDVWDRLNRPILNSHERDFMFIVIHNILPTREWLFRLNQCRDDQCTKGDGLEDVEHIFAGCVRYVYRLHWLVEDARLCISRQTP